MPMLRATMPVVARHCCSSGWEEEEEVVVQMRGELSTALAGHLVEEGDFGRLLGSSTRAASSKVRAHQVQNVRVSGWQGRSPLRTSQPVLLDLAWQPPQLLQALLRTQTSDSPSPWCWAPGIEEAHAGPQSQLTPTGCNTAAGSWRPGGGRRAPQAAGCDSRWRLKAGESTGPS